MTELLLRMLLGATLGLALVLVLRRPARNVFGSEPACTLWLLPIMLMLAPLLPRQLAPMAMVVLPGLTVTPAAANGLMSQSATFDWPDMLLALWLAGSTIALLRLGIHYVRLLRGLRAAPATWARVLEQAAPGLDVRRVREHAAGPALLWALPRSLILLPDDFADRFATTETRELVLRHELVHARRGDALWSLAMEIASALLWFHPLAWIGRARFRLDLELACDAASLRALPEGTVSYARALLHSVAVQSAPALIPWLSEPQLKERIAMIMRIPPGALRRRAGFAAIAILLAGGSYLAGAAVPAATAAQARESRSTPPAVYFMSKNHNPPRYPVDAIHKGEQGIVILDVTIDASGNVAGVRVDQHGTNAAASLQIAAVDAAEKWKFSPGRKNGKPVAGTMRIPVRFSLSELDADGSAEPCPAGDIYDGGLSKCVKLQGTPPSS